MQIILTGKTEEALHRPVQTGQFGSAEEAVAALLDDYAAVGPRHNENGVTLRTENKEFDEPECFAEWMGKFDELLAIVKPRNPDVDDSRESIYPVR
ncbi:MAG: hypothetical protein H7Z17_20290 [Fuerstia sp.]|nr:hypothetical protein [Fuerstiella sp.]